MVNDLRIVFLGVLAHSLRRYRVRKRRRLSQRQQRIVAIVEALGWASGSQLAFLDGADLGKADRFAQHAKDQVAVDFQQIHSIYSCSGHIFIDRNNFEFLIYKR